MTKDERFRLAADIAARIICARGLTMEVTIGEASGSEDGATVVPIPAMPYGHVLRNTSMIGQDIGRVVGRMFDGAFAEVLATLNK